MASELKDVLKIRPGHGVFRQAVQVPADLLCHRCGQDSGIRPRIGHKLLLIQFLDDPQRLIGADLEPAGTVILQLRQIVKERRILLLFLLFHRFDPAGKRLLLRQIRDQRPGVLLFLKPVFFIQLRRQEKVAGFFHLCVTGACRRPPLSFKRMSERIDRTYNPVKGRLHEFPDLPFPADYHAEHAGHDAPHGYDGVFRFQIRRDTVPVLQRQQTGEIDPHQVVFFGS